MSGSTIAAVSTPPGHAPRGVIRVSGPRSAELARAVARGTEPPELARRGFWRGRFDDGRGEQPLLLLWMPAPHSYTREDVAEFHLPGNPYLLDAALARLFALGAEPARPGEFTRRAFENGRIDLLQAEGVLAMVQAANESERRAAAALLFGGLGERVAGVRDQLEGLRALCEASLDFDETDTLSVPAAEIEALGRKALGAVEAALAWEERREPLSALPRISLVGRPNAGKSSLFNALAGGPHALVSEHAGTTRDGVAAIWRIAGVDCRLVDTPGIADGDLDEPDRIAQELARAEHASADLLLWVVDAAAPGERLEVAERLPKGVPRLIAWNKIDLPEAHSRPAMEPREPSLTWVAVSALEGRGLGELADWAAALLGLAGDGIQRAGEPRLGRELSLRHRHALESSRRELAAALDLLASGAPLDLAAEALRAATDALDDIAGRTTPEDLLDRIFARFCLGK
jgi:tRNA modification GTPase